VAARVSPNFLDVLGVRPFLGRGFQPGEGEPGARPVVLISQSLWKRRFASDPASSAKPSLSTGTFTLIGVMPPDFALPFSGIDVWVTRLMNFSGSSRNRSALEPVLTATARSGPVSPWNVPTRSGGAESTLPSGTPARSGRHPHAT